MNLNTARVIDYTAEDVPLKVTVFKFEPIAKTDFYVVEILDVQESMFSKFSVF